MNELCFGVYLQEDYQPMIKFFRRIRRHFLSENKFSKYLLYATGEIVLVVIGILIALSINNWNERRKETRLEIKLAEQLLADARADSIFFESRISFQKIRDTLFNNFTSISKNISRDSISELTVNIDPFFYRLAFHSNLINNNPTAYDLVSNEPIKNSLREYIKRYDYVVNAIELNNRICEQYGVPLQIKYNELISELTETSLYADYMFAISDKETMATFNVFRNYGLNYLIQCQEFLQENDALIKLLERYLKENQ